MYAITIFVCTMSKNTKWIISLDCFVAYTCSNITFALCLENVTWEYLANSHNSKPFIAGCIRLCGCIFQGHSKEAQRTKKTMNQNLFPLTGDRAQRGPH